MQQSTPLEILQNASVSGVIAHEDMLAMRAYLFGRGPLTQAALSQLFAIERARTQHSDEWSELFRETVVDLAIHQTPPDGYLSDANAKWLIEQIGETKDARVDTELEALVSIVEKAQAVPLFFSAYVLRQIKRAVIYSDQTDAHGLGLHPGAVGAAEVRLLQRVLWGAGSGGLLAIDQEEAEALFDIDDATAGAANDPAWDDLFARAIGNYLIGATARSVPTREDALRMWNTDYHRDVVHVLTGALLSVGNLLNPRFIRDTLDTPSLGESVENRIRSEEDERAKQRAINEQLVGPKADWLADRIRRNGRTTDAEARLLIFLRAEASRLSPQLQAMVEELRVDQSPRAA